MVTGIPYSRDFQPIPIGFDEAYTKDMWPLEFVADVELKGSEEQPARVEVWADTGSGMKKVQTRETRAWEIHSFCLILGEGFFSIEVRRVLGECNLLSVLAAFPQ